jgi:hypothetical protein
MVGRGQRLVSDGRVSLEGAGDADTLVVTGCA